MRRLVFATLLTSWGAAAVSLFAPTGPGHENSVLAWRLAFPLWPRSYVPKDWSFRVLDGHLTWWGMEALVAIVLNAVLYATLTWILAGAIARSLTGHRRA